MLQFSSSRKLLPLAARFYSRVSLVKPSARWPAIVASVKDLAPRNRHLVPPLLNSSRFFLAVLQTCMRGKTKYYTAGSFTRPERLCAMICLAIRVPAGGLVLIGYLLLTSSENWSWVLIHDLESGPGGTSRVVLRWVICVLNPSRRCCPADRRVTALPELSAFRR